MRPEFVCNKTLDASFVFENNQENMGEKKLRVPIDDDLFFLSFVFCQMLHCISAANEDSEF